SHLIWFFANPDYEGIRPPTIIPNTPIVDYFLSNLGKKVEIPLLNKVLVNNHTTYSIRGTKDVLRTIKTVAQRIANGFESFLYPFGINENLTTPPLTIKSIRKLKDLIPLLNKMLVNNHTTYSIKGTKDVLQTIKAGETYPGLVAQKIANRFESFLYPFDINDNLKTPPLTIKSIRKLKDLVNYEENSPYEVEVEEEIEYITGISHLICFFANPDYEDIRPPKFIPNTPIVYYILSNLGKKVEIPLLNKVLINNLTIYSIKGTKDALQTIEDGKSNPDL
ncbi:12160_t:CDS:2, partial [Racocetra fulgida]